VEAPAFDPLPSDPAALVAGEATPDAVQFVVGDGVVGAFLADGAGTAHSNRFANRLILGRKEKARVGAFARRLRVPPLVTGGELVGEVLEGGHDAAFMRGSRFQVQMSPQRSRQGPWRMLQYPAGSGM
jgi:hypothetical protein